MKSYEKDISFLNRYFVYKKFMEVVPEKVELELGEYQETDNEAKQNSIESKAAVSIAKEEQKKLKPKVRKLTKKLLLVAATEALDDKSEVQAVEKEMQKEKAKKEKKVKKIKEPIKLPRKKAQLTIEESDED